MSIEHAFVPAPPADGAAIAELTPPVAPVDEHLVEAASDLVPGRALLLGCANPQDSIWLAQRGWTVTAVDGDPEAVAEVRRAAGATGVSLALQVGELGTWRPASRYDLVSALFSLPARGTGRSRMLEMAVGAVAPGGTIVISELDISLHRSGRMAERYLVSVSELERYLDGFRMTRTATRMARRRHGYEELQMPVALVVASRRTDLRTLY